MSDHPPLTPRPQAFHPCRNHILFLCVIPRRNIDCLSLRGGRNLREQAFGPRLAEQVWQAATWSGGLDEGLYCGRSVGKRRRASSIAASNRIDCLQAPIAALSVVCASCRGCGASRGNEDFELAFPMDAPHRTRARKNYPALFISWQIGLCPPILFSSSLRHMMGRACLTTAPRVKCLGGSDRDDATVTLTTRRRNGSHWHCDPDACYRQQAALHHLTVEGLG